MHVMNARLRRAFLRVGLEPLVISKAHIQQAANDGERKLVGLLSSADLAAEIKEEFDQYLGLEEIFAKHTH